MKPGKEIIKNKMDFPVIIYSWREMLTFEELRGFDYLFSETGSFLIVLFTFPFLLILLIFRDQLVYKYTFQKDCIKKHYIYGMTFRIKKEYIQHLYYNSNEEKLVIHWKKNRHAIQRVIRLHEKSFRKYKILFKNIVSFLNNSYTGK
jgi:hypothetical protein